MTTQYPNQPLVTALWLNIAMRKTAIIIIILIVSICFSLKATAQQLELSSAGTSTTNKGPVPTSASPTTTQNATLFSNTGTSATFNAYAPTITVSVGLSNQQYVSSTYPGVTIGSNVNDLTKTSLLADFLYHPINYFGSPLSNMFTSAPDITTTKTNFDVANNYGFVMYTDAYYQGSNSLSARSYYADMTISFSRPVINPVLHFSGLGTASGVDGVNLLGYYTEFELSTNDVTAGRTLTKLSGSNYFSLDGSNTKILNTNPNVNTTSSANYASDQVYSGAGSVMVNTGNTPISSVTFRIYLKGNGGAGPGNSWTPLAGGRIGDGWMLSASLGLYTVSGTAYDDANGLNDNTVNGTGTNTGNTLYANLVDANGNVYAVTTVASGGTYSFTAVPSNYTIILTTTAGTVGSPLSTSSLPSGWISTGENLGTSAGNDGTVDGKLSVTIINANVANVNFGIEKIPTANAVTAASQTNPGGTATVTVPTFTGSDLEDQPTSGSLSGKTVIITTLPSNGTLYYNGTSVTAGQTISSYIPALLTVDPNDNISTLTFTYQYVDNDVQASTAATVTMPFTNSISGNVYNDADGLIDNTVDGTGTNAGGINVVLYDNTTGAVAAVSAVAAGGTYSFNATPGDAFTLYLTTLSPAVGSTAIPTLVLPVGYGNTGENIGSGAGSDGTPDGKLVVGTLGTNVANANFGILTGYYDFGDAPASYELNSSGTSVPARNAPSNTLLLGTMPDEETAPASVISGADNNGGNGDGTDEDGIATPTAITVGAAYSRTVTYTNTSGAARTIYGWIDFNNNGIFETSEATTATAATATTNGTVVLSWTATQTRDIMSSSLYMRIRVSTATSADNAGTTVDEKAIADGANTGTYGTATIGEVEDYQVSVTPAYDFGDAPISYESNSSSAFAPARNTPSSTLRLGIIPDAEIVPASVSSGADNNGSNGDGTDEDGITSPPADVSIGVAYSSTVAVTNTSGAARTLYGWIDFNRNGRFEVGEVTTANVAINATSATLTWTTAQTGAAIAGKTYMRLRIAVAALSDAAGTSAVDERSIADGANTGTFGATSPGEVEDYQLNLYNTDIAVHKVGPVTVNTGGSVSYSIKVSNYGPGPASNVTVSDPAVANLNVSSITCTTAGTGSSGSSACPATVSVAALQAGTMTISSLPNGSDVTFTVTGTATGIVGSAINNVVTVALPSGSVDADPTNNSSTLATTILDAACTGSQITYTLNGGNTVNANTISANGGTINLVYNLSSGSAIPGIGNSFTVSYQYSDLNSYNGTDHQWMGLGSGGTFTNSFSIFPATSNAAGALITGSIYNGRPANNQQQETSNGTGSDAQISTYLQNGNIDQSGTFDITIGNYPTATGYRVVSKTLQIGTVGNLSSNGNGNNQAGYLLKFIDQPINNNATNTAILDVEYGNTYSGKYAAFSDGSNFPQSGTVTRGVAVRGSVTYQNNTGCADLQIVKTGAATVAANGTISYTLVVTNNGSSPADGATVSDPAVANFSATGISCGSVTGGAACPVNPTLSDLQAGTLAIPTLPSGGSVTFTVIGTAGAGGAISNTTIVTAPTGISDAVTTNNTSTANTVLLNSISGTVYNDTNGLTDNTVNGTGTNAGGTLNAILYDITTGSVASVTSVASGGTYTLSGTSGDNFKIYITTNTATVGQTAIPIIILPTGYINTGENLGAGAGSDGTVDGILSIGTISANTTNANFGITPAGYIYVHKKTLDESSSVDFSFSVSGGATTVPSLSLNDNPTQVTLADAGSSQNGRLWAVGTNNTLYYRDMGSAAWTATNITNASRVDGGGGNTAYVVITTGDIVYFDGTTGTTIGTSASYGNATSLDVGSAWDNQPYMVNNTGYVYRYSGSGTTWNLVTNVRIFNKIDGNPATGGFVVSGNQSPYNIYSYTSAGVETSLGRPSGIATATAFDVAVDASGNIYATFANTSNVGLAFKWTSGTTWSSAEATSRSATSLTGGIGGELWAVMNRNSTPFGNIFSRSLDGSNIWWIDDERVRTSPTNGNSEMMVVVPGTYTITETVPANWDLQSITLYDPSSNSNNNTVGNTATLTVSAGETVHAIFTNGAVNPFTMTNSCANAYTDDFGSGTAGSYGPALTGQTSYHYMNTSTSTREGYYKISGNANVLFGGAASLNDHTSGNGTGYMMIVDAGYDLNEFFRRRFNGLVIGATYNFSAWIANINTGGAIKPNVTFKVVDPTNYNTLATNTTGDITTAGWQQYTLSFTATATSIDLILSNNSIGGNGNDLALDDISFTLVAPQTPIATTITNNGSGGCFTSGNIQVTAPVGSSYEYSLDNSTYQSSVNFNTLSPAFYTVYARFVGTTGCVISKADTIRAYVCGNVFDDANGLKDNTVNSSFSGTNVGGTLNAVLYDNTAGKVSAITTVAGDGTYSLGALPAYNSTVYLTTNTVTLWQTIVPTAALPYGWANTGEHIGTGTGSDGTADGILPLSTVNTSVTNANFGIDQLPSGSDVTYVISPVPTRGSTHALTGAYRNMLPLTYYDPEDCQSVCPDNFGVIIKSFGNMNGNVLSYNGVPITPPYTIANYKPDSLTVTFNQSGFSSFNFYYVLLDAAGVQSIDPNYNVSWGSSVLAVNLLSFTAEQQGEAVLLKWSTAAGSINDKFTVERSVDSRNWAVLKTIAGTGSAGTRQDYSYTDNSPLSGSNYYRIKQVDKNGNNVYSETRLLKFGENWIISLSPNPVTAGTEVRLHSNQPVGMIRITDLQGRIVLIKSMPVIAAQGSVDKELNTASLAAGTYLVQVVSTSGKTQTLKLIKL